LERQNNPFHRPEILICTIFLNHINPKNHKNHSSDISKNHSSDINKNHSSDINNNQSSDIMEAYQLNLFDNLITVIKPRKSRPAERSKDSAGKYVSEIELPGKEEFNQIEARKNESVALMIRLLTEENFKLKEQIKKYRKDG